MALPQSIDRYEVLGVLGRGAMGSVYRAWDPKLHREVAIKIVARNVAEGSKVRERFRREARAIAALKHPNIVEIYDYSGDDSHVLYLVMEKLEGDDLFNVMTESGPLPESVTAAIGHELCLALQVAHDGGVIHRDLKPENVVLGQGGRVVLMDFGVVKAVREDSAVEGFGNKTDIIGTPGFMAPELLSGKKLGPYSDVFALGSLLYNIVTLQLPYEGEGPVQLHRAMQAGKYIDPRKYVPELGELFCTTLEKCLLVHPKRRPQGVREVREALRAVLEEHGVTDLRDELAEFVHDPATWHVGARRREVQYLLRRLKVAVKDKKSDEVAALHRRMLGIDPQNRELAELTGVLSLAKAGAPAWRVPRKARRQGKGIYTFALVGALAAAGLAWALADVEGRRTLWREVQGAVADLLHRIDNISLQKTDVDAPPAASDAVADDDGATKKAPQQVHEGKLRLRIRGGTAVVLLDGKRLGRLEQQGTLALAAGSHRLEVSGRGKRLKQVVEISDGGDIQVNVDLRRGRISARNLAH